ncbi:acyltransferase [Tistrella mobilis]|uniref:acyltransferase family protein n=1 Tax=Tistrella mobilis TaxID=171437 RepID=UPI003558981D
MQSFISIESLRAWMAWWVVVGHALRLSGLDNYALQGIHLPPVIAKILGSSGTAVNVFIIVSGFVITHLFISKQEAYSKYITRRAFRLFPVYLVCLAAAIITMKFYILSYVDLGFSAGSDDKGARLIEQSENFWIHLAAHLTMLHGLIPDEILPYAGSTILSPAWSLSLEWQFYLIAPVVVAALMGRPAVAIATAMLLLATHAVFTYGGIASWQYLAFLPLALNYFLLGIMSRLAISYGAFRKIPAYVLVIMLMSIAFSGWKEIVIWGVFYAFALSEANWFSIRSRPVVFLSKVLAFNRYTARFGKWSYSTYLIHLPVFVTMVGGYAMVVGLENVTQAAVLLLLAAAFPLVLLISWLLYSWIEVPFIAMGRRVVNRPSLRSSAPAN